jgi:hypothetical protein
LAAFEVITEGVTKHGLEFGRNCCELRDELKSVGGGGTKGLGFSGYMESQNIPRGPYEYWISQYEISIGVKAKPGRTTRSPLPPWRAKTPDGTQVNIAVSAAQKAVRDGDEQAGVYWIRQLYFTNAQGLCRIKVWKKLHIFAAEEIALGDLSVKTHLLELETAAGKCKDERNSDLLHVIEGMMICCRAEKSRATDNAILWMNENPTYKPPISEEIKRLAEDMTQPAIPDKVYDKHTVKGRQMGRGDEHFKNVAAVLSNPSDVAPFAPTVRESSRNAVELTELITTLTPEQVKDVLEYVRTLCSRRIAAELSGTC